MNFILTRTSSVGNERPHERAYKKKYVKIDERRIIDAEKRDRFSKSIAWLREGKNHAVNGDKTTREFEEYGWFIRLRSLKELMEFQKEAGDIIIKDSDKNPDILEIEIYDNERYTDYGDYY